MVEKYDPVTSPLSSYQDRIDKYKVVPRLVVLLLACAYLGAIYYDKNAEIVYQTGMFLSIMTIAYIVGVDALKDIVDALIKNKGIHIPELTEKSTSE